jgi:tripartite-type tricarboxylate transporter receptor subunit TctC
VRTAAATFVVFSLLLVFNGAHAANSGPSEAYPQRPVRLVVPYPPGGTADVMARLMSLKLGERWSASVVVDNRGGAGGTIATELVARSEPNGHTLLLCNAPVLAINPSLYKNVAYDPVKDFAPIIGIAEVPLFLLVHPSVPVKTYDDFLAYVKSKKGDVNYASGSVGSTTHLSMELFKHMAAIDIVHVPYKGAGPALTDLIGGQVQMLITGFSGAAPHIKAGRLRALGATGAKRMTAVPDLPTIGETVPGYEVTSWYGIVAPVGTPPAVIAKLHAVLAAMVHKPEVSARLVSLGIEPEGSSPQEFAEQTRREIAKWAKVVKVAGVKLD